MPTKRTRINRGAKVRVTQEMAALLRRCDELQPIYEAHGRKRPANCVKEHCTDCSSYLDALRALDGCLGLRPWQTSPANVDLGEPPDWVLKSQVWLDDWHNAQELRRQIQAAA